MFKVGDIVTYNGSTKKWKDANLKFQVILINDTVISTINLQDIPQCLDSAGYAKGEVLHFHRSILIKCIDKKNHLPKWF